MHATADIVAERIGGIEVLRRRGSDPHRPLLLLHGVGSNAASFIPLMRALPATYDIVSWNAPGYGGSEPLPDRAPTPGDYANAVASLMTALGWSQATIVGHSLGALFAANLAADMPDRVAALGLLSPALGYGVPPGAPLPDTVQARIDEIEALGPDAFAQKRAARLVSDPNATPGVLKAVRSAMAAVNPAGYAQAVRALGAGDLLADATRISLPAFVAVGLADVVTPPANARAAHAALRHAVALEEIAGAGHALPQEQPDIVASLIGQWVERHAAR